jgi:hypothetical protein
MNVLLQIRKRCNPDFSLLRLYDFFHSEEEKSFLKKLDKSVRTRRDI